MKKLIIITGPPGSGKTVVCSAIKKHLQLQKGTCINSSSLGYIDSYTEAYVHVTPRAKSAKGMVNHLLDMPVLRDESPFVFLQFQHDLRQTKGFQVFSDDCTYIHLNSIKEATAFIEGIADFQF